MNQIEHKLKKYALYLLGRRAYSEGEIRNKLINKFKNKQNNKLINIEDAQSNINPESSSGSQEIEKMKNSVILGQRSEDLTDKEIMPSSGLRVWQTGRVTILVDNVVKYLSDLNLLDDEAYAKSLVESLLRLNKSRRQIINKLNNKQINNEILKKVLSKDNEQERESLANLIRAKLRHSPDLLTSKKGKEKLIRFLIYRGFSYGDVKKEIEKVN